MCSKDLGKSRLVKVQRRGKRNRFISHDNTYTTAFWNVSGTCGLTAQNPRNMLFSLTDCVIQTLQFEGRLLK